jgi:hypothetical protein
VEDSKASPLHLAVSDCAWCAYGIDSNRLLFVSGFTATVARARVSSHSRRAYSRAHLAYGAPRVVLDDSTIDELGLWHNVRCATRRARAESHPHDLGNQLVQRSRMQTLSALSCSRAHD